MSTDTLPTTLTVEQAGQLLGLSRSSAYRAAARGELPTLRFGRRILVPTGRVLAMLGIESFPAESRRTGEPAPLSTARLGSPQRGEVPAFSIEGLGTPPEQERA